jgi:hypothetical protein
VRNAIFVLRIFQGISVRFSEVAFLMGSFEGFLTKVVSQFLSNFLIHTGALPEDKYSA